MDGCQEIMTSPLNVVVNPTPAMPTAINSGPICIGDNLDFQVSSIVENGSNIRFDWFNSSDLLIGASDTPLQSFNNVRSRILCDCKHHLSCYSSDFWSRKLVLS